MSRYQIVWSAAAVSAAAGLALTGCGSASPEATEQAAPTAATATATPDPVLGEGTFPVVEDVDRQDPQEVASATARLAHSWDTQFDTTQTDGLERAKPLMSNDFADTIQAPGRNAAQGEWVGASKHRSYSVPQLSPTLTDIDTDYGPNRKAFPFLAEWEWVGRDGEGMAGQGRNGVQVFVERESAGDEWEVVGYVSDDLSV